MPTISERRLDSLAKILECSSICVAVCCVNKHFFISANELAQGSAEHSKQFVIMSKIMNYFKDLANTKDVKSHDREQLIQDICGIRIGNMSKGILNYHKQQ